jgi:hypothetical protein
MTLSAHALSGLQKLADSAAFPVLSVEERAALRVLLDCLRRTNDAD